ncbi:DUF3768 domain-containing protein [Candidatus Saccharibacteria bacterium]|nr:DUF3768 domain-containing protein [Candidatus Saccharibacteria bacterium]
MDTRQAVNETSAKIAAKNDAFRRSMEGCTVTRGVAAMGEDTKEIFVRVRDFTEFTEDNDPYGEHDFGSFTVSGVKIFWKIDYYDESLGYWCDPLSPDCNRVLTIMLAEEY